MRRLNFECPGCRNNTFSYLRETVQGIRCVEKDVEVNEWEVNFDGEPLENLGEIVSVYCNKCGYEVPKSVWMIWNWRRI